METVLSEVFSSLTGQRARILFATMLVFYELPEPLELIDKIVDIVNIVDRRFPVE